MPLCWPGCGHPHQRHLVPSSDRPTSTPAHPRHPEPTYLGPLICLPNSQPKLLSQLLPKLSYAFILGRKGTGWSALVCLVHKAMLWIAVQPHKGACHHPTLRTSGAPGGDTGCPSHTAPAGWGWNQKPMLLAFQPCGEWKGIVFGNLNILFLFPQLSKSQRHCGRLECALDHPAIPSVSSPEGTHLVGLMHSPTDLF